MPNYIKLFAHEMTTVFRQMPIAKAIQYAGAILISSPQILASRSLDSADRYMKSVHLDKYGRRYHFDGIPFALIRELYLNEKYFLTPEWRPTSGDVVVDLGANRGTFSVLCAGLGAEVIAVEALSEFTPVFEEFAEKNGVRDQIDYRLGLLCDGYGEFDAEQTNQSTFSSIPAGQISITEILASRGCDRVALVKADIEGAEFRLPSDEPGLLNRAERIAMEVHPSFGDSGQLVDELKSLGFVTRLENKWGDEVPSVTTPVGFLYAWRE